MAEQRERERERAIRPRFESRWTKHMQHTDVAGSQFNRTLAPRGAYQWKPIAKA